MKKILLWILVILICSLIYYSSNQPGEVSDRVSKELIGEVTSLNSGDENVINNAITWLDYPVRKFAHVFEFLVLTLSICALLSSYSIENKILIYSFFLSLLYAISDEIHQLYVIGRSGSIKDVFIDSVGIISGLLICKIFKNKK